jgi:hypothetical protein
MVVGKEYSFVDNVTVTPTYALASWLFLRGLAVVYLMAFVSLLPQALGLWGSGGILPITMFLSSAERALGFSAYWHFPTVFWLRSGDTWLIAFIWLGILSSLLALIGFAQGWMFLACYALYLSFVSGGQDFLSFQWDNLLLEVGFLALFIAPWSLAVDLFQTSEPHWIVLSLVYLLIFKLMFSSGLVKLLSGDPSWRDLTALTYHYWTQPLPNILAPFFSFMPLGLQKLSCLIMFAVELGAPFLIFFPTVRWMAGAAIIGLMFLILISGNYAFFNWLTIVLAFFLIPDSFWHHFTPWSLKYYSAPDFHISLFPIFLMLLTLNVFWLTRFILPHSIQEAFFPLASIGMDYRLSSPYGLFAQMTKDRPEIIIEGSDDGVTWKEYEFPFKPGPVNRRLPMVAPYQPRLDWQMWFAALSSFNQNAWMQNLMIRLLQNSSSVLALFSYNPFPNHPPQRVRAQLYRYEFTSFESIKKGIWWQRTLIGRFSPDLKTSQPRSSDQL